MKRKKKASEGVYTILLPLSPFPPRSFPFAVQIKSSRGE